MSCSKASRPWECQIHSLTRWRASTPRVPGSPESDPSAECLVLVGPFAILHHNQIRDPTTKRSSPLDSGLEPVLDDSFDAALGLDDARYPRTTNSGSPHSRIARKASNELMGNPSIYGRRWDLDDDPLKKEGAFKVYGDLARQPEVKQGMRVKSSEALLKEALAAAVVEDAGLRERDMALRDPDSDDPDTPEVEKPQLHRATSVKARRVYSDDAKLIELSSRGSREAIHSTQPMGVFR